MAWWIWGFGEWWYEGHLIDRFVEQEYKGFAGEN
jgi:hypothetical protein